MATWFDKQVNEKTGKVDITVIKDGKRARKWSVTPEPRPFLDLTISTQVNGFAVNTKQLNPADGAFQLEALGKIMEQASRHVKKVDSFFSRWIVPVVTSRIKHRFENSFFTEGASWKGWAESTWRDRTKSGKAGPSKGEYPEGLILVDEGDMKNANDWVVIDHGASAEIQFYNNDPKAEIHQDGFKDIPARPFMGIVADIDMATLGIVQVTDTVLVGLISSKVETWLTKCLRVPLVDVGSDPLDSVEDTSFDYGFNLSASSPSLDTSQGDLLT